MTHLEFHYSDGTKSFIGDPHSKGSEIPSIILGDREYIYSVSISHDDHGFVYGIILKTNLGREGKFRGSRCILPESQNIEWKDTVAAEGCQIWKINADLTVEQSPVPNFQEEGKNSTQDISTTTTLSTLPSWCRFVMENLKKIQANGLMI